MDSFASHTRCYPVWICRRLYELRTDAGRARSAVEEHPHRGPAVPFKVNYNQVYSPYDPICFVPKLACFVKESNVQPVQLPVVRLVSNAVASFEKISISTCKQLTAVDQTCKDMR